MLDGMKNFLELINENWTLIIAVAGLLIGLFRKAKTYFGKSDEEKIEIAKKQITESILKWISDAEEDYNKLQKAGSIKRAQVIGKIFEEYPILSKVVDQDELISWIDEAIDNALDELRNIIKENDGTITSNDSVSEGKTEE